MCSRHWSAAPQESITFENCTIGQNLSNTLRLERSYFEPGPAASLIICAALSLRSCKRTSQKGHSEQALDRHQSMTYLECDCSYRRAGYTEEEEMMQRRSSACSQYPPCLGVRLGENAALAHPHAMACRTARLTS